MRKIAVLSLIMAFAGFGSALAQDTVTIKNGVLWQHQPLPVKIYAEGILLKKIPRTLGPSSEAGSRWDHAQTLSGGGKVTWDLNMGSSTQTTKIERIEATIEDRHGARGETCSIVPHGAGTWVVEFKYFVPRDNTVTCHFKKA